MGLTQKEMSHILRVERSTYTHYEGGVTPKTLHMCRRFAETLGVTMDWLTGYSHVPKWGPTVQQFQVMLRSRGSSLQAVSVVPRCLAVVDLMKQAPAPLCTDWFQAGVLGLSLPAYQELLSQSQPLLGPQSVARLSVFSGLSEMWLMLGGEPQFASTLPPAEYEPIIIQMVERGLRPEEVLDAMEQLERYIHARRTLG